MGETIATNKKAFRDFTLIDRWEAGLVLKGGEVKSVRAAQVDFRDSFARVEGEEVFLYNLYIAPYEQASYLNSEPNRKIKLLLNKKEIRKIYGKVAQRGFLLMPTKMYFNARGIAKVEIALAQGKRQYDKREDIKKRDTKREIDRMVKQRRK